jgi:predicted transcriptional regulator
MPVEFDEYTPETGRVDLTEGTNARQILLLLLENPGIGFTPAEIHEETGISRGSINPTLARLEEGGLVRHKGGYWAAEQDGRLAAASAAVVGLGTVSDTYSDDWYAENPGWSEERPD